MTQPASGEFAACEFNTELLASFESMTSIGEQHGLQTMADLLYLIQAIRVGGFVDELDGSQIRQVLQQMPSASRWLAYVGAKKAPPSTPKTNRFIEIEVPADFADDKLTTFDAVEQSINIRPATPYGQEQLRALLANFIADIEVAFGDGNGGVDFVTMDWPDLADSYRKARAAMDELQNG